MSAAKVEFLTLEGEPCPHGEKPSRFTFRCVNGNRGKCSPNYPDVTCASLLIAGATDIKRDGQGLNGGRPQWDWNGNRDGWHGYLRAGRCVSTSGQDEPE
jgi:hypothetical protein